MYFISLTLATKNKDRATNYLKNTGLVPLTLDDSRMIFGCNNGSFIEVIENTSIQVQSQIQEVTIFDERLTERPVYDLAKNNKNGATLEGPNIVRLQSPLLPGFSLKLCNKPTYGLQSTSHNLMVPTHIDHVAIACPIASIWKIFEWIKEALSLKRQILPGEDLIDGLVVYQGTDGNGMTMLTLTDDTNTVNFTLVEPKHPSKGTISRFLAYQQAAGVHHFALHVKNIVGAVTKSIDCGIKFLTAPSQYYEDRKSIVENLLYSWEDLQTCHILIDLDTDTNNNTKQGVLYQIFAEPIDNHANNGVFVEFIQRDKGAMGFGQGNVTALYVALSKLE